MMRRITAGLAQVVADAMSRIHDGWDIPGCRRLLLDAADLAPEHEIAAAGILFAGMTPASMRAPLAEVFTDRSRPWWRGLPEAAKTIRPSDLPRCPTHDLQLSPSGLCSACESERKAAEHPASGPVVMVDEAQAETNRHGADTVRAAMREHGIPERRTA